jgi:hypothetical protein
MANLTKMRKEKLKTVQSETQKDRLQQTTRKSSEAILRAYILIYLKVLKK